MPAPTPASTSSANRSSSSGLTVVGPALSARGRQVSAGASRQDPSHGHDAIARQHRPTPTLRRRRHAAEKRGCCLCSAEKLHYGPRGKDPTRVNLLRVDRDDALHDLSKGTAVKKTHK